MPSPRLRTRAREREVSCAKIRAARSIYYSGGAHRQSGIRRHAARDRARAARDAFYAGDVASDIVRAVRTHAQAGRPDGGRPGGLPRARARAGVRALPRRGASARWAPPSSGGVGVLQILGHPRAHEFRARAAAVGRSAALLRRGRQAWPTLTARDTWAIPRFVPVPVARCSTGRIWTRRAKLIGERAMTARAAGRLRGRHQPFLDRGRARRHRGDDHHHRERRSAAASWCAASCSTTSSPTSTSCPAARTGRAAASGRAAAWRPPSCSRGAATGPRASARRAAR